MILRNYFVVIIALNVLNFGQSISGVIWNKKNQTFDKILSIHTFANLHKECIKVSRQHEMYNFRATVLKASYYQEPKMVIFNNAGTEAHGIFPDIWGLLADYLNFTLISIKYDHNNFGVQLENGSYTGVLSLLKSGEIQIIYRTGIYLFRLKDMDYTTPIWKIRYRLYIRPIRSNDNQWIIALFSKEVWYLIICLIIVLSLSGYIFQKPVKRKTAGKKRVQYFNLHDHFFYTFSIMCSQGYIPEAFYNKFKILSLSKSVFAWLLLIAFNSHLIYRMTYRIVTPPFDDFQSLLNKTKYKVTAFKGSMIYESLQKRLAGFEAPNSFDSKRIEFETTPEDMQRKSCYSKQKYAMLNTDDKMQALDDRLLCRLVPIGKGMYETWITSGISKGMKYKRAVDIGNNFSAQFIAVVNF
ncbi:uncharacterized protein [Prorops nasuta]|uniref:uncharacterized protein isoform X2 n=1 Tax=Prorops nasuta TaxID=863751 RepID=UPI0034CD5110